MTRTIAGPQRLLCSALATIAAALAGPAMAGSPGKDGSRVWYRVTWNPQDGGVREIAHTSKDAGKSWQPAFDILFVRAATGRGD